MTAEKVELEQWRALYDAAARVRTLAPWKFLEETDLFGVQDPETGELGFVSVMGALGQHYAVAVYRGAHGLYGFWAIQSAEADPPAELILETPQLQLSFGNRGTLQREDRDVIAALGLTFKGRSSHPMFRSYRPGFLPWLLEPEEARFLLCALDQLLDVAPRLPRDAVAAGSVAGPYFLRARSSSTTGSDWYDSWVSVRPPEAPRINVEVDPESLDAARRLPRSAEPVEIDFFMSPAIIAEKNARPYRAYALLVVSGETGLILSTQLYGPAPTLEAMWSAVPGHLVAEFSKSRCVPLTLVVRTDILAGLLQPLAAALRIQLRRAQRLPALDAAKSAFMRHFSSPPRRR